MTKTTHVKDKTNKRPGKLTDRNAGRSFSFPGEGIGLIPIAQPGLLCASQNLDRLRAEAQDLAVAGNAGAAIDLFCRILSLDPQDAASHFRLAQLLFEANRFVEAAQSYAKVVSIHPEIGEAYLCLGRTLHALGDHAGARQSFERAVTLNPGSAEALSNLASLYMDADELQASEVLLRRAVQLEPDLVAVQCNFGCLLEKRGDTLGAAECFRVALTLDPTHAPTLCNLGSMLDNLGDASAAANCYRLALASKPDDPLALFNLSTHLLADGNFTAGWRAYESRWLTKQFSATRRRFQQPVWSREDIRGLRIFLYTEQGLGDSIQFARYVPWLACLGAEVIFEVQPAVYNLLRSLDGAAHVIPQGTAPLPDFDLHSPLMSLPSILQTDLGNLTGNIPYIFADEDTARLWSQRMQGMNRRVGLVWSGNPKHARDRLRSIPLARFEDLLRLRDITFYSLQKGPAAAQLLELPQDSRPIDLEHDLRDFTDTAAVIANLDLVITVDTAVAHLAGAMGKPVWILLPRAADWRWLKERTDSPWYPTARLFRQSVSGGWEEVLERVYQELALTDAHRETVSRNDRRPPAVLCG